MAVAQLFDKPWEELTFESLCGFLKEAGDEGLLWEAKGAEKDGGVIRKESIYKALSGFTNSSGGYLLLGVEREHKSSGRWVASGMAFPDEPELWTSSIITAEVGLAPVPVHRIKVFPIDAAHDGVGSAIGAPQRHVVVVQVEPLAVPPCVTGAGAVFMRASGQTKPVIDQRVLADLIRKGESARESAAGAALRAAQRVMRYGAFMPADAHVLAVGFCAVSGPDDMASVLFDKRRADTYFDIAGFEMTADASSEAVSHRQMSQDALYVLAGGQTPGLATEVGAFWDGAVAAVLTYPGEDVSVLDAIVKRYWRGLVRIAEQYGATGDAHLAVVFNFDHQWFRPADPNELPVTDIRRWTTVAEPTEEEKSSVSRELNRAFGRTVWSVKTGGN
jgi:hypothetical protein